MNVLEAIKKRRSVRVYLKKDISKKILRELVNCARLAPSGRGENPWEFVVIRKRKTLRKLSLIAEKNAFFLKDAAACIGVFCKPTKYYLEDGSAATQNILLAATSYGIGSCWIAGDKKEYTNDIKKLIGVPREYKLVSLISLGYPAKEVKKVRKKRFLEEVIHWEKF